MLLKFAPKAGLVLFGFIVGYIETPKPNFAPTMKEVVEILADYDVRHIVAPPGAPFYAVTDHDRHIIYILDNQDFILARRSVIHELAHVTARLRGEEANEDTINAVEEVEYKRLFVEGGK